MPSAFAPIASRLAKSIWGGGGDGFRSLMGISASGSSAPEIEDSPQGYAAARTAESYVFRAMDVRAKAISQVPLVVWETDRDGMRQAVEHEALGVLDWTNPLDYVAGTSALMRYTLMSLDGQGRCTWKLAVNGHGVPTEVYWLPPVAVTPLHGFEVGAPDIPFGGVRYVGKGSIAHYTPEEIVYFATDNPEDPILGTSRIKVLRDAINLRRYSVQSNAHFFRNSARPDWILSGQFANTQENIDRIKRAIQSHFSGESNRAPLILGEGATAHLLTTSQKDAEWLAQQRLSQEEIAAAFGLPVMYLNNLERATYSNIETAKLMLWHDTMIPECDILASWLSRKFLWRYWPKSRAQRLSFGFDYQAIEGLGDDVAKIWERLMALAKTLWEQVKERQLTPNMANQVMAQLAGELGLDPTPWTQPVPNGDDFLVPYTLIPSTQTSMQAVIDALAARGQNAELVENILGAEHAGDNAQVITDRHEAVAESTIGRHEAGPRNPEPAPAQTANQTGNEGQDQSNANPPDAPKSETVRRLKKHYQAIQREAIRKLGSDELYDRAVCLAALKEFLPEALAVEVEDDLHLSVAGKDRRGISAAITTAIEQKADAYAREAAGERLPIALAPGVRVYA